MITVLIRQMRISSAHNPTSKAGRHAASQTRHLVQTANGPIIRTINDYSFVFHLNTTPDPELSLVKMSESGHFTAINLIKQRD